MSTTTMLFRRLAWWLASDMNHLRSLSIDIRTDVRKQPGYLPARTPLRWRTPWAAWQGLSWFAATLLAPPFWIIGTLLFINADSDQPAFWSSVMVVVALSNAVTIAHTNQRHHQQPFLKRRHIALHYSIVGTLTGAVLLLFLACATDALPILALPFNAATNTPSSFLTMAEEIAATVLGFCLLSFAHASMLHAWLAFEDLDR